ncbi:MAG: glycosyltransferase family 2 protein, partial [Candidatus Freyarchaeota archaeon]|nr:glycosyltransferase family 2 protein [Candidatus Jordarchaeia archaeon]
MGKGVLISIVTPTYDRANLLKRAIRSVLNQTYQKWELIIVDDPRSTHRTEEVVRNFEDRRIKYYRSQKIGLSSSRNRGMELSRGKYIVFLDSDDELMPHALETIVKKFEALPNSVGGLFYNCIDFSSKTLTAPISFTEGLLTYDDVICGKNFQGELLSSIRKKVSREFKFPEEIVRFECIFWFNVAKKYKFYVVNKPLRIYHTEANGRISRKAYSDRFHLLNNIKGQTMLLKTIGNELKNKHPKKYGEHLLTLGLFYARIRNAKSSLYYIAQSIKYTYGLPL